MQDTLQALLGLQEIDRRIFQVEAELRRLPLELEARRGELARKDAELQEHTGATRELRAQVKEIEDLTTQQRQRQRKLESEAARSKTDAALLAAYDHEIRGLKRTIGQAEEDGLKIVEHIEQLETAAGEIRTQLEAEKTIFEEFSRNVEVEMSAAEAKLAELREQLESRSSNDVLPEHLDLYRKLLASREGEALAELHGRVCQGCFVEIPKNLAVRLARGVELIQCPSCDRILHVSY